MPYQFVKPTAKDGPIEESTIILEIVGDTSAAQKQLAKHNQARHVRSDDDRLILTLSSLPKHGQEFRLGSGAAMCDIILGEPGDEISEHHLSIAVGADGIPVMMDSSKIGTEFKYGKGQYNTRKGTRAQPYAWTLPTNPEVSVKIGKLKFTVTVPDHSSHRDEYMEHVSQFRELCRTNMPDLSSVNLSKTVLPTTEKAHLVRGAITDDDDCGDNSNPADDDEKLSKEVYVPDGRIGVGAFGVVKMLRRARDWTKFAGKMIKGLDNGFHREISMLMDLLHPHIVNYCDSYQDVQKNTPVLVMEYCQGGTLAHPAGESALTDTEVLIVLDQCLQAVEYLHEKGITHRDIKPANILLRSRQPIQAALADFGLAKLANHSMSTECGTPGYMAPEIVSGSYTCSVDIYALGCVTQKLLYSGSSVPESRERLEANKAAKPLRSLLHDMQRTAPEERPTARQCLERLREIMKHGVHDEVVNGQQKNSKPVASSSEKPNIPKPIASKNDAQGEDETFKQRTLDTPTLRWRDEAAPMTEVQIADQVGGKGKAVDRGYADIHVGGEDVESDAAVHHLKSDSKSSWSLPGCPTESISVGWGQSSMAGKGSKNSGNIGRQSTPNTDYQHSLTPGLHVSGRDAAQKAMQFNVGKKRKADDIEEELEKELEMELQKELEMEMEKAKPKEKKKVLEMEMEKAKPKEKKKVKEVEEEVEEEKGEREEEEEEEEEEDSPRIKRRKRSN